jgi:hypothetical protein
MENKMEIPTDLAVSIWRLGSAICDKEDGTDEKPIDPTLEEILLYAKKWVREKRYAANEEIKEKSSGSITKVSQTQYQIINKSR